MISLYLHLLFLLLYCLPFPTRRSSDLKLPKQMIRWFENRHNQNRQLIIFVPTISMTKKIKVLISNFLFCRNINQNKENVDRKSTRLNSSHVAISYAVFCLKTKTKQKKT